MLHSPQEIRVPGGTQLSVPVRRREAGRFLPGLGARHTSCCSLGRGSIPCPVTSTYTPSLKIRRVASWRAMTQQHKQQWHNFIKKLHVSRKQDNTQGGEKVTWHSMSNKRKVLSSDFYANLYMSWSEKIQEKSSQVGNLVRWFKYTDVSGTLLLQHQGFWYQNPWCWRFFLYVRGQVLHVYKITGQRVIFRCQTANGKSKYDGPHM